MEHLYIATAFVLLLYFALFFGNFFPLNYLLIISIHNISCHILTSLTIRWSYESGIGHAANFGISIHKRTDIVISNELYKEKHNSADDLFLYNEVKKPCAPVCDKMALCILRSVHFKRLSKPHFLLKC